MAEALASFSTSFSRINDTYVFRDFLEFIPYPVLLFLDYFALPGSRNTHVNFSLALDPSPAEASPQALSL